MRTLNKLMLNAATVALAATTPAFELDHMICADLVATITGANVANKTFVSGVLAVQTLTFPAKISAANGDYIEILDAAGLTWAVALDTLGTAAATPTGAVWAAIPAGRKVYADISTTTIAATVAAAAKAALNALTGFTAALTLDDGAADGSMTSTATVRGPVAAPVPHTKNDGAAGSITGVQTTTGVVSKVDLTAETATIAAHGYTTGALVRLTTTSTLPAGVTTGVDYYLIALTADTIQFATTQAHALAGTAINLTDFGSGTHTVAVTTTLTGAVKLQKCDDDDDTPDALKTWFDITSSSQAFAAAATLNWTLVDIGFRLLRAVVSTTSGTVLASIRLNAKGV